MEATDNGESVKTTKIGGLGGRRVGAPHSGAFWAAWSGEGIIWYLIHIEGETHEEKGHEEKGTGEILQEIHSKRH